MPVTEVRAIANEVKHNIRPLLGAGQEEVVLHKEEGERELTEGEELVEKPKFIFHTEMKVATSNSRNPKDSPTETGRSRRIGGKKSLTEFEQIEADCRQMRVCLRKMELRLDDILSAAKDCKRLHELIDSPLCFEDESVQKMESAKLDFVSNLDVIHRIIAKRPPMVIDSEQALTEWDDIAPLYRDIRVAVDNGSLYVKTPPLLNRNRHWTSRIQTDYFATFSSVVERKVLRILDELPCFVEKNVTMIAVYSKQNAFVVDTDNLDTKTLVDAIVGRLPGEDCGECCSFFSASVRSEALQEGAYFTVSEGFARVPDFNENIQNLERIFGRESSNS